MILDRPFPMPTPTVFGPHAMVNLIGTSFADALKYSAGHRLHWYGKEPRPGRKVGHINMENADSGRLKQDATALLDTLLALE